MSRVIWYWSTSKAITKYLILVYQQGKKELDDFKLGDSRANRKQWLD